jgi:hypothetical protein
VPVSIRDALHSPQDRAWIQKTYAEYLEELTRLSTNTGIFPIAGEFGEREPELLARWFADDSSHPLIILKNDQRVAVRRAISGNRSIFEWRSSSLLRINVGWVSVATQQC